MNPRKIQVTSKQLDRLLDDVQAFPEASTDEHLSDDQFVSYSMSTLSPEDTNIVDQHLVSCSDCATEMERLVQASESWNSDKSRLSELASRTISQFSSGLNAKQGERGHDLRLVGSSLQELFAFAGEFSDEYVALAAETNKGPARRVWSYKDPQSGIDGQGFLDSNGDLIIVFTSKEMKLKDRRLHLEINSKEGELIQRKTLEEDDSKTEVGATFVIPRYQVPKEDAEVSLILEEAES